MLIALVLYAVSCGLCLGQAYSLPPAVQLGGAIVAAVEQDAEQELAASEQSLDSKWLEQAEVQIQKLFNNELSVEDLNNMLDTWTAKGMKTLSSKNVYLIIYIQATRLVAASITKRRSC